VSNTDFTWGEKSGEKITEEFNIAYDSIRFIRQNTFAVPKRSASVDFVDETIRLIQGNIPGNPLRSYIAAKARALMLPLLCQSSGTLETYESVA
jgi:hypothetical protein